VINVYSKSSLLFASVCDSLGGKVCLCCKFWPQEAHVSIALRSQTLSSQHVILLCQTNLEDFWDFCLKSLHIVCKYYSKLPYFIVINAKICVVYVLDIMSDCVMTNYIGFFGLFYCRFTCCQLMQSLNKLVDIFQSFMSYIDPPRDLHRTFGLMYFNL